jgi:hypothetical protein
MPTPTWQGGTLYPTGSLVQPASAPPPVNTEITNAGFESGDTDWTKGTGWTINASGAYQGSWAAQYSFTGTSDILNDDAAAVTPGQSITAACMVQQGASSAGQAGARIILVWLTAGDVVISTSLGTEVNTGSGGAWGQSTITAVAPATAAKVKVGARAFRSSGGDPLWVDVFTWNYLGPASPSGLIYRAVQPNTGSSGDTEPVWPLVLGVQVNDGTVIWEAVAATRVTWQANAIFLSGMVEPTWPLIPGEFVLDGSFQWEAVNRYVDDENCPNTTVVAILASHVFAADDDIVKFSAVNNALDWTTMRDAGYLPTGLQQANANEMAVLAPYRANLAALNASSFQLWQADPDPAAMVILDQQDGIGSVWPRAAVAIAGELYYLAALGVRTISQAAGNNSLSAGDVGMPVDEIVQELVADIEETGATPVGAYYPSLGQYLLAFPEGYVPLHESGHEYIFEDPTDSGTVLTDSTVTGASEGAGPFAVYAVITFQAPGNGIRCRVNFNSYEGDTNGAMDSAPAGIYIGGVFTENQTTPVGQIYSSFAPSEVNGSVSSAENVLVFSGISYTPSEAADPTDQFSFSIEVSGSQTNIMVHTRAGKGGAWSRYIFPFVITDFSLRGNDLYFRQGDTIMKFDKSVAYDEMSVGGEQVPFAGAVQWNWLDCGQPGTTKQLHGFDFVGSGSPSFSVGYDERNKDRFTTPYAIDADTLPGGIIPLPVVAPSMSFRVDFAAGSAWSLKSVLLYVDDLGNGP